MKHISPIHAVTEMARAPTRRTLAKLETRAKVLAAARKLFSEQGYEGATIRDIATAAGMSTGAVFANFTDKSDLFREIMSEDIEALIAGMREAAGRGGDIEQVLLAIFSVGYRFYSDQMPLARAAFSVSWTPREGNRLRALSLAGSTSDLIAEQLMAAVGRGELTQSAEVRLRAQMLYNAYLSNYVHAIFDDWTLEAIEARSRDQIRILLAGARRS